MIVKWTKVSTEVLFKKFGKEFIKAIFLNPVTNKKEEFYFIKQKNWSSIFATTENGEVVVTRQYKQGCNEIVWELPAGTPDFKGENPSEVIQREFLQETGMIAKITQLGSWAWMASRNSDTQIFMFRGENAKKIQEPKSDPSEEIETHLIPLPKWLKMIASGKVRDPSSISATFLALLSDPNLWPY